MWKLNYITEGFALRKQAENICKESFCNGYFCFFFSPFPFYFSNAFYFFFAIPLHFSFFFLLFIAILTEASETIFKAKKINKAQERPSVTEKMLWRKPVWWKLLWKVKASDQNAWVPWNLWSKRQLEVIKWWRKMNEIKSEVEVKIMMDGFNINKAQCIWQVGTHGTHFSASTLKTRYMADNISRQ